jgi:hypothetical protein
MATKGPLHLVIADETLHLRALGDAYERVSFGSKVWIAENVNVQGVGH